MNTFANYHANDILKTVDEAKVEEEETTPPTNSHIGVRVFLKSIFNFYKFKKDSFCATSWVQPCLRAQNFGSQPLAGNFWRAILRGTTKSH